MPPAPWVPPDPEAIGVSRRQFLNRATVTLTSVSLGAFAAAGFVAFLWPIAKGGFGGQVARRQDRRDHRQHPRRRVASSTCPRLARGSPSTRPTPCRRPRRSTTSRLLPGMEAGIVALYQKCPHLGCRVPQCVSSQWFECPCHGSQYNRVGEKKGGPAPRGMDHFAVTVSGQRRRHRRHRHRRHRPADRHQHHRPGGRRSALHHRGRRSTDARMLDSATTAIAWVIFVVILLGWVVYFVAQRRRRRSPSSAPRSSSRPTASRTTTTRRSRAARLERVQLLGVLLLVVLVIGLPLYWVFEPSRQAGARRRRRAQLVGWGGELFATTAEGGFNCAGCHGGMNATGGSRAVHDHRPDDRRGRRPSTGRRRR